MRMISTHKIAIEKEIDTSLNDMTLEDIFGARVHRGRVLVIADEPASVIPYAEDTQAYNNIDTSDSITLDDYMTSRWLIA